MCHVMIYLSCDTFLSIKENNIMKKILSTYKEGLFCDICGKKIEFSNPKTKIHIKVTTMYFSELFNPNFDVETDFCFECSRDLSEYVATKLEERERDSNEGQNKFLQNDKTSKVSAIKAVSKRLKRFGRKG